MDRLCNAVLSQLAGILVKILITIFQFVGNLMQAWFVVFHNQCHKVHGAHGSRGYWGTFPLVHSCYKDLGLPPTSACGHLVLSVSQHAPPYWASCPLLYVSSQPTDTVVWLLHKTSHFYLFDTLWSLLIFPASQVFSILSSKLMSGCPCQLCRFPQLFHA